MCNEMTTPQYEDQYRCLRDILFEAFKQGSSGKGHYRHATGDEKWEEQITATIAKYKLPFPEGQAVKKIFESMRLSSEGAVEELLGAINYLCFAINHHRERKVTFSAEEESV